MIPVTCFGLTRTVGERKNRPLKRQHCAKQCGARRESFDVNKVYKRDGSLTEAAEQERIFRWAAYIPELKYMYAVPNGGSRNRLEAANMKLQGVKRGVSDICLPLPKGRYCGLYIELKTKGNKASCEQAEFLREVNHRGYCGVVCYGFEEAKEVIERYLAEENLSYKQKEFMK